MSNDDDLITAHIVAKRLGIGRAAIYDWMRSANPVPAYRVGKNALRFRWSEVKAWLETRRVTAPTVPTACRATVKV